MGYVGKRLPYATLTGKNEEARQGLKRQRRGQRR